MATGAQFVHITVSTEQGYSKSQGMFSGQGILSPLVDRSWLPPRTHHLPESADRLSARTHAYALQIPLLPCLPQRFLTSSVISLEQKSQSSSWVSLDPTCQAALSTGLRAESLPGRWGFSRGFRRKNILLTQEQPPVTTPNPVLEKWRCLAIGERAGPGGINLHCAPGASLGST